MFLLPACYGVGWFHPARSWSCCARKGAVSLQKIPQNMSLQDTVTLESYQETSSTLWHCWPKLKSDSLGLKGQGPKWKFVLTLNSSIGRSWKQAIYHNIYLEEPQRKAYCMLRRAHVPVQIALIRSFWIPRQPLIRVSDAIGIRFSQTEPYRSCLRWTSLIAEGMGPHPCSIQLNASHSWNYEGSPSTHPINVLGTFGGVLKLCLGSSCSDWQLRGEVHTEIAEHSLAQELRRNPSEYGEQSSW